MKNIVKFVGLLVLTVVCAAAAKAEVGGKVVAFAGANGQAVDAKCDRPVWDSDRWYCPGEGGASYQCTTPVRWVPADSDEVRRPEGEAGQRMIPICDSTNGSEHPVPVGRDHEGEQAP